MLLRFLLLRSAAVKNEELDFLRIDSLYNLRSSIKVSNASFDISEAINYSEILCAFSTSANA